MKREENKNRLRAKNKLIRVTFPNGKVICYSKATDTLISTLKEIGKDKFPLISLKLCHLPLMSKEIYPAYKDWMKPVCGEWYVNTQSDTTNKYMQLRAINDQLALGLSIEIGTDFNAEKCPDKEKRSRTKDKLLVRFPDGEFVANDSALETFLETIWRLGIEDIMRKHISWGSKELITSAKVMNSQIQVGANRWIIVPNTTRDKAKLLRVIGAMLHVNMEINTI